LVQDQTSHATESLLDFWKALNTDAAMFYADVTFAYAALLTVLIWHSISQYQQSFHRFVITLTRIVQVVFTTKRSVLLRHTSASTFNQSEFPFRFTDTDLTKPSDDKRQSLHSVGSFLPLTAKETLINWLRKARNRQLAPVFAPQ